MKNKTPREIAESNAKVCQLVESKFKAFNIAKKLLIQKLNTEVFELCDKEKVNEHQIRLIAGMPRTYKK